MGLKRYQNVLPQESSPKLADKGAVYQLAHCLGSLNRFISFCMRNLIVGRHH